MAKGFIAIDPKKQIRQFTEEGIYNLKRLHNAQGVQGWQYGKAEDADQLLSKIVTPADAQQVLNENAELKARLALLEAKELEAKASKKSAKSETTI
jgi:thioredoxin-like negative regulator of GroEL